MASKKKVLVIDDELTIVDRLKFNLELEGYEVFTAFDGMEGLKQIQMAKPDLVICDVMMPEMDGFEVCRRVRMDTTLDSVPFIFLTAKAEIPEKIDGFNAGADDYMTKPFELVELTARVNAALNQVERVRAESQDIFRVTSQDLNRLSALGILAASIAHEVRNQLTTVVNSAEMLRLTRDEPKRIQYTDVVVNQIEQINDTICSMLNFARRQDGIYEPHDIKHIVEASLELTRPGIDRQRITVELDVADDLPLVSVDRQQISQVLINLIINASQAMDEGVIKVRGGQVDQHIEIRVSDNGSGIPEDVRDTIFNPFVSTRTDSGGIGLGLYICKEIIEAHNGDIVCDTKEGEGTTFTVTLPVGANQDISDDRNGHTPAADIKSV